MSNAAAVAELRAARVDALAAERAAEAVRAVAPVLTGVPTLAPTPSSAAMAGAVQRALIASAPAPRPTPAAAAEAARRWSALGETWTRAGGQARVATGELPKHWEGDDARAALACLTRVATQGSAMARGCENVAELLARAAARAEAYEGQWRSARAMLSAASGGNDGLARLLTALDALVDAYESADDAAIAAADVLRSAGEKLTFAPVPVGSVVTRVRAGAGVPGSWRGGPPKVGPNKPIAPHPTTPKALPAWLRKWSSAKPAAPTPRGWAPARSALTPSPGRTPGWSPARTVPKGGGRDSGWSPPTMVAPAGEKTVSIARSLIGTPYVWGGTTTKGFDCSGFTKYVYARLGVSLPRTAAAQRRAGTVIPRSQARPGDLVCMPGHVGIYAGNGRIIDSPRPGKSVSERPIWTDDYVIVRVMK